jgi:zinc and cadmium transporter
MVHIAVAAIVSTIIVSLISVLVAIPFFFRKNISKGLLLFLLSGSVGVLMATVFLDLIPETYANGFSLIGAIIILAGFLTMFILEKIIHWHHSQRLEDKDHGHTHAYSLAPINLIGDGLHNFIDGLVIAGAYIVDFHVGITATIAIIFHEIPQEIADFGVLVYSGLSKMKALFFNLLSGLTEVAGTILGLILAGQSESFSSWIIPFAAGNFIYIAASNILPELHRESKAKESLLHIFAIILGIVVVVLLEVYGPTHHH